MIFAHTSYLYVYMHKTYVAQVLYYITLQKSQSNTFDELQQTLATNPQEERSGCHNSAHLFVNYEV